MNDVKYQVSIRAYSLAKLELVSCRDSFHCVCCSSYRSQKRPTGKRFDPQDDRIRIILSLTIHSIFLLTLRAITFFAHIKNPRFFVLWPLTMTLCSLPTGHFIGSALRCQLFPKLLVSAYFVHTFILFRIFSGEHITSKSVLWKSKLILFKTGLWYISWSALLGEISVSSVPFIHGFSLLKNI